MTNSEEIFRTRELSLSVFLVAQGAEYLGSEKITDNSYYFTFADPQKCYELERKYRRLSHRICLMLADSDRLHVIASKYRRGNLEYAERSRNLRRR